MKAAMWPSVAEGHFPGWPWPGVLHSNMADLDEYHFKILLKPNFTKMKTMRKLSLSLVAGVFAAALFTSSGAFAQIAGGEGNTTINAADVIQFKGTTAGTEWTVKKANTQHTIKDGTQGAGKVLTSDADGNASWQNKDISCGSIDASGSTSQTVPINDSNTDPNTVLVANTEIFDPLNAYDPATGVYTIPQSGFYAFKGSAGDFISGQNVATRNSTLRILSAQRGNLAFSVVQDQIYANGSWNTVSSMNFLNAGDQITFVISVVHVSGTKPAASIAVSNILFSGSRIDCNKN